MWRFQSESSFSGRHVLITPMERSAACRALVFVCRRLSWWPLTPLRARAVLDVKMYVGGLSDLPFVVDAAQCRDSCIVTEVRHVWRGRPLIFTLLCFLCVWTDRCEKHFTSKWLSCYTFLSLFLFHEKVLVFLQFIYPKSLEVQKASREFCSTCETALRSSIRLMGFVSLRGRCFPSGVCRERTDQLPVRLHRPRHLPEQRPVWTAARFSRLVSKVLLLL